ncbi:Gfo/Idh/MocA family oxidoreductase [Streptomyces sp. NEAU-sy36]|uniref:Gfo/Idh/MocA family protein n=1 Tax=unclassified Streptomyces TaxID=2593676 RepID=UPI0015D642E6|nr:MULTISPECIES: Gfo/Idh/MocA family oxidoreductase [unclassified Streptomyces]QLJ03536.1 Gfo/Idh/MocA family oxidoreductase [Streptomyces sp. NEAU-sy36]
MADPLRIGVVGAGNISGEYLETLSALPNVRPVQVATRDPERARAAVARFPGTRATSLPELYASDEVDLVLDLTTPAAHLEVSRAAIEAGKHLYGEKPLAMTTGEARSILTAASAAGVRVGCAPDTVLGTGIQTARVCVEKGEIGTPVAATAFMTTPGHELWHPDPEFYYRPGGGPLLDMGPYYLTALVLMLGPVRRVTGLSGAPRRTRTIGSGPRAGTTFPVEVATHVTGVLEHEGGALSTLMLSFDVWRSTLPRIEVYGTEGTLAVPDPNSFTGDVRVCHAGDREWRTAPVLGGYRGVARGIGVADMAHAIATGTPHRASAELAYHVLDLMESLLAAAESGGSRRVDSGFTRPEPVPAGARPEDLCPG